MFWLGSSFSDIRIHKNAVWLTLPAINVDIAARYMFMVSVVVY